MFYARLFDAEPTYRDLFPDDMTRQKRMLIGMLNAAVANLHDLESIGGAIRDLGKRHISYDVSAEHYDRMSDVLLDTFGDLMGDAFDDALREAWRKTYAMVVKKMIEGAEGRR